MGLNIWTPITPEFKPKPMMWYVITTKDGEVECCFYGLTEWYNMFGDVTKFPDAVAFIAADLPYKSENITGQLFMFE